MQKITQLNDVPSISRYLGRIGAKPRSLRTAVVEEQHGKYWEDLATIRFDYIARKISVTDKAYAPTKAEEEAMIKDMEEYIWPSAKLLGKSYELPDNLKDIDKENLFEFRNRAGQLVMLQERTDQSDRGKYRPWTYFDDDVWRPGEPEHALPLWGMEHLGNHTTVFIHEGAKAARAMHRLTNPTTEAERQALQEHPWGKDLIGAAHLGWIGGALNPWRTDWRELGKNGVKEAYIVADNDVSGFKAIPRISKELRGIKVFSVEFNERFPPSFDMADPWPEEFYVERNGKQYYQGPIFDELLRPATWATRQWTPPGEEKPVFVLCDEFRNMWGWAAEADMYVCLSRPTLRYPEKTFDRRMLSFSHKGSQVSKLLCGCADAQYDCVTYQPGFEERIINYNRMRAINLYVPSPITSRPGDATPFLEFMTYFIPDPAERHELMRWCATLIARPELRMTYAALLVSETQGTGKNTLGEKILAPLVGMHNCSFPNEKMVVDSQFNGWLVNKRFSFIGEIYTGRSWKAANNLKAYITDRLLAVNEKYIREYQTDNFVHIMACSNSLRALKLDNTDRRWFIPRLTETPWPHRQWVIFNNWLLDGGLHVIRHWAETFGDYVLPGQHAPMTERKREMQKESESEALQFLYDWCAGNVDMPISVAEGALRTMLTNQTKQLYESNSELRRYMDKLGWKTFEQRMKVDGILQSVIMSPKVGEVLASKPDPKDQREYVRTTIKLYPIDSSDATI